MPAETTSEVELSYQTESVESFAPEAVAAAPVEMDNGIEPPTVENSIMDQPANYYTMQLMASVDIDRVIRFANENEVSTEYIVATERDGVIWHVLLLDIYPDYSSAVAARDEISPRLKNEPWIRGVGSVQKLVR
jgi:septal ring-binding cell division protein DamX